VQGFAVPPTLVALGEVGLAGELRAVSGLSRRVREAQRLGATDVLVPCAGDLDEVPGVMVHRRGTLAEAIVVAQSGTF